jgi:hypothetical protein
MAVRLSDLRGAMAAFDISSVEPWGYIIRALVIVIIRIKQSCSILFIVRVAAFEVASE